MLNTRRINLQPPPPPPTSFPPCGPLTHAASQQSYRVPQLHIGLHPTYRVNRNHTEQNNLAVPKRIRTSTWRPPTDLLFEPPDPYHASNTQPPKLDVSMRPHMGRTSHSPHRSFRATETFAKSRDDSLSAASICLFLADTCTIACQ